MSPQCGELGSLADEIGPVVWGTPANFIGFRVLASLLQRRRSPDANKTARSLAVSWAGTVCIHFGSSCPLTEFCQLQIHFPSKSCVLLYWQHYCAALEQRPSAKLCGMVQGTELQNFRKGRHLGGHHVGHRPYSSYYILRES